MNRPYLHPPALRIWHWLNAAIVMALIATGLDHRFHGIAALAPRDPALLWHKGLGLALIAVSIFWFVYSVASGNLAAPTYGIKRGDLRGMARRPAITSAPSSPGELTPSPAPPLPSSIPSKRSPIMPSCSSCSPSRPSRGFSHEYPPLRTGSWRGS